MNAHNRNKAHENIVWTADEKAILGAMHKNPRENTIPLVFADALQESGKDEVAEFVRFEIEHAQNPGASWNTKRYGEIREYCIRALVSPMPRGMHFLAMHRGLPRVAVFYMNDDFNYCVNRMPLQYCVQLVLDQIHRTQFQVALRHRIMAQVHSLQFHALDEHNIRALADTPCVDQELDLIASSITTAAFVAAQKMLPKAILYEVPLKAQESAFTPSPNRSVTEIYSWVPFVTHVDATAHMNFLKNRKRSVGL